MKNGRQVGRNRRTGKVFNIKSQAAREWEASITDQAQLCAPRPMLQGPLQFSVLAYYRDNRSDLDVELLYDALQKIVYKNDRQIVAKCAFKKIDARNPRCECLVREIATGGSVDSIAAILDDLKTPRERRREIAGMTRESEESDA
jgi:Holliday junction resolvase RusA-like endonuclease